MSAASPSLEQVLAAYLENREAGMAGSRERCLESHPVFASELAEYFATEDILERAVNSVKLSHPAGNEVAALNGLLLGSFELLHERGRGGMGAVFVARDVRLDRLVAVKLLGRQMRLSDREIRRFQNEAESASRLDHPHIVPIYGYGEQDGQCYLAMKLIEGPSLAEWQPLRQAGESPAAIRAAQVEIARVLCSTAWAIQHAHERGILHRDLKPSNILLGPGQQPVVVDFGLAKQLHRELDLTYSGMMLGTPSYMAPELVSQRSLSGRERTAEPQLTAAVDIYGLGTTLYFLLTGEPPFKAENLLETLSLVRNSEVSSVRNRNPQVDRNLEAICLKCLAKEPSRRYLTAAAVAEDLERWLAGAPVEARPATAWSQIWNWCRRHRVAAGWMAGLLASGIMVIAILSISLRSAALARQNAQQHRQVAIGNMRAIIAEIKELEDSHPELDLLRTQLLQRVQAQLQPMLDETSFEDQAEETDFWLAIDLGEVLRHSWDFPNARRSVERAATIVEQIPEDNRGTRLRMQSYVELLTGELDGESGLYREALRHHENCLAAREKLVQEFPGPLFEEELALAEIKAARLLINQASATQVKTQLPRSLEYSQRARARMLKLVALEPDQFRHVRSYCLVAGNIVEALTQLKEVRRAYAEYQQAIRQVEQFKTGLPQFALGFDEQLNTMRMMGTIVMLRLGEFVEAEAASRQILRHVEQLVDLGGDSVGLRMRRAFAWDRIAMSQTAQGRMDDAIESFAECLQLIESVESDDGALGKMRFEFIACRDHRNFTLLADSRFRLKGIEAVGQQVRRLESELERADSPEVEGWEIFRRKLTWLELCLLSDQSQRATQLLLELERDARQLKPRPDSDSELSRFRLYRAQWRQVLTDRRARNRLMLMSPANGTVAMGLQDEARVWGDARTLALASQRLAESDVVVTRERGAAGLAEAILMDPAGTLRTEYAAKLAGMLRELQERSAASRERVQRNPLFESFR